ncbi:MAG: putative toxin-antitoxin system toxin component, PIN family, partial [Anaerolineae bacterium]
MLRIVFDTNIYISAALRGAQAEAIFQLAALGKITLITSPAILGELAEKLTDKFNWDEEQVTFFVETIEDVAEVVEPQLTLHVVEEDEDDNRILECVIEGEAGLIVTYDRDLLRLKAYENVGIVTPVDLLHFGL